MEPGREVDTGEGLLGANAAAAAERVAGLPAAFGPAPFSWKMGVRPLDLDAWLIVDRDLGADRTEKSELLRSRHDEVVVAEPGSAPAAAEVHRAIIDHLAAIGVSVPEDSASRHPIEAAARPIQEDLVLLQRDAHDWRMTAACVCFPTRWRLTSKTGRSMGAIHGPVPRYASDLGAKVDRFLDRLRVDHPVWRTNWTIDTDWGNRLEPDRPVLTDPTIDASNVAERLCLRLEYQTLRRFPGHDTILFTIRILRRPLASVLGDGTGAQLAAALNSMPDDVAAYKAGTVLYRREILDWLVDSGINIDGSL